MPLLTVSSVVKRYGPDLILDGVGFQIEPGEHVAFVGANGTGKSTLLRIIAGTDRYDSGQVSLSRNAIVTYVSQDAEFVSGHTLWDAMLGVFEDATQARAKMRELEPLLSKTPTDPALDAEYRRLSGIVEHAGYDYESRIERVLVGLELEPEHWTKPVSVLSGGQRTRANLARALLGEPDLLLLDEPTNHLDVAAIEWLESYLKSRRHAFIVVAHDRYFLESTTKRTLELTRHRIHDYPASYIGFVTLRAERIRREEQAYQTQQEQIAATEDYVRRYGAGQRSKEAQGRKKRMDRVERVERPQDERSLSLRVTKAQRKGDVALRLDYLSAGYAGKPIVIGPDALSIPHGAHVAIVGPNGSGKTTLAKTLLGDLATIRGRVAWAPGSVPSYYAQSADSQFRPGSTVLEAFEDQHPVGQEVARTFLGSFLFEGDEVYKAVGDLSGGERSRLALACLLYSHPTILVLDEPTNHLDIAAREALEMALERFGGTLILITHDRYLVDRIASEIWSIEPPGGADVAGPNRIAVYDGNWQDFAARRHRRPLMYSESSSTKGGDTADQPAAGSHKRHRDRHRGKRHRGSENGHRLPETKRLRINPEAVAAMESIAARADVILARLEQSSLTAEPSHLADLTDQYALVESELRAATEQLLNSHVD